MEAGHDDGEIIAVAPTGEERQAALRRVAQHAVIPLLFGAVAGALWQVLVMPQLGPTQLPNPVHGALLVALLCSPLAHRALARRPME
ncbi:MAG: hypothetical protein ACPH93_02255, partial [Candidatus Poseidoniaceae archaeon]